jgi:Family of unknown function (DUF6364)
MKNITLALDEKTLKAGRAYARQHQTTLNSLVRDLLQKHAGTERDAALTELLRVMDAHPGNSKGRKWRREDLYAR